MIKQYEQTTSKHGSLTNPTFTPNVKCTKRTMKPLPTSSVESVVENGNYKLLWAFSVWTSKKFMSESQLGDHLQEGRKLAKFTCGNSRRFWSKSNGAWEGWKISSSCKKSLKNVGSNHESCSSGCTVWGELEKVDTIKAERWFESPGSRHIKCSHPKIDFVGFCKDNESS